MNPILYDSTETEFKSNGLGRLSECTYCTVTEERNGIYECEFQYPIAGKLYANIQEGMIICVTHDDKKDRQPFVIYRRSAPMNGIVTFNAHHVSYALANIVAEPFGNATSAASALANLKSQSFNENPFGVWTDNTAAGTFNLKVPRSVMNALRGSEGSVLDVFGGEFEFDKWLIKLYAQRGNDNGVTIRYGKNLTDIVYEADIMGLYDAIVPYWTNGTDVVWGTVNIGNSGWSIHKVVAMDFSTDFEELPTAAQLNTRATTYLSDNRPWIPKANIKVNFVALWQTEEYKNIAPLERVRLCDTVKVIYAELGVEATAKVIKTVWNPLLDRYDSIELGEAKTSFAETITENVSAQVDTKLSGIPTTSMMQEAIDHATELITGGLGGHIVFLYDANGKPTDMLVMDTKDVSTAVHILRINVNGIGFSSDGGQNYSSAWTLDGEFVADWITAGHLSANRIQGGVLTLGGANNGNGQIVMLNASDQQVGVWDKDGFSATGKLRSVNGNEWMEIDESIIKGGYGNAEHGLLDLSAQYQAPDGAGTAYCVSLTSLQDSIYINSSGYVFVYADDDVRIMPTGDMLVAADKAVHILAAEDVYIAAEDGARFVADGNASIESTSGDVVLRVANNSKDAYISRNGMMYEIVDSSGPDSTGVIRHLYRVTSSGNTYLGITNAAGNTLFAELTASDEKLKTNIADAENVGLEAINKIQHKSFDFIDGGYHRNCGYIAQQLQDAIPYSTIAAPECDEDGNQTGELLQIVDHEVLVYATKAIQELSAKVGKLERRLQEV